MNVLVAGATGFVGSHLVPALLQEGHNVRCLTRDPDRAADRLPEGVDVVRGDVHEPASLADVLTGMHAAYYLVHSMEGDEFSFEERDRAAAGHFAAAAERARLERIIFLGGLGDPSSQLSAHLRSRHEVGDVLRASRTPVTELRAGLILGAGSASYVMLQQLVERLPVMITPRWVHTRTQPIALIDVIGYLVAALNDTSKVDNIYQIGGPEVMTYRSMMTRYARARGLRRLMMPVPVLSPRLSSYWVDVITDVPAALARPLIEGLRSEMVVRDDAAARAFGPPAIGFEEALAAAESERSARVEAPLIWLRRLPRHLGGFVRRRFLPDVLSDERVRRSIAGPAALWASVTAIGGRRGYPMLDPLWRLRGWIDRLLGGPGIDRSASPAAELHVGARLDFWRVVEIDEGHRLRMRGLMKLPGDAELELVVHGENDGSVLVQAARFRPNGVAGRMYWWCLYPLHALIFSGMAGRVARRAENLAAMSATPDHRERSDVC
jgi:uncharacterized protein YbjT (DUF2867 family)